jgi:hypothetical protein
MLEQCPLLAQSGHHDGAPECLLSGAKRTLRGHALMAAFDRKRTSGGARLREGQREKGRQQKIADTEGVSFLRFQNWARGRGAGPYAVFPIAGPFRFCFFHTAQAPLRVGQNDSSGQSVFLGQLVEEGTINSQSSSRGSKKWRHFGTSKWSVQPPKNAQLLFLCASRMPRIGPASI